MSAFWKPFAYTGLHQDIGGRAEDAGQSNGFKGLSNYGRYWVRTSDLFRVKEARYHCANRPRIYDHTMSVWESIAAFEHPVMFTIFRHFHLHLGRTQLSLDNRK